MPHSAPPLLFLHVPKTAGSALIGALSAALDTNTVHGFDRLIFGGFADFASMAPARRGQIVGAPANTHGLTLPPDARWVAGHLAYSTLRAAYPHARIITILREARARIVSHFLFWRAQNPADLADFGTWRHQVGKARSPLAALLTDPILAAQFDNMALRLLLAPHPLIPQAGFISPRHDSALLTEAQARLAHLTFLGTVEMPDLPATLGRRLGLDLHIPVQNQTPAMPPDQRGDLSAELAACAPHLAERARLDNQLWAWAMAAHGLPANPDAAWHRALPRFTRLFAGLPAPTT